MMASLSLSEASKISGMSIATVRRWIKMGSLKAHKSSSSSWRIEHEDLKIFLATANFVKPKVEATTSDSDSMKSLEIVQEALQRERMLNDELRKMIHEKDSQIREIMLEMKSLLSSKSSSSVLSRWLRT